MKYVAFLRGINVGGHTVIKNQFFQIFNSLHFKNIKTVLASGNIIFESELENENKLTAQIESALEKTLGYPVSAMLRTEQEIAEIIDFKPFRNIQVTKNTRRYVTFLQQKPKSTLSLPKKFDGFEVLLNTDREVFIVLTITAPGKTPDVMNVIEKEYGKVSTTRNWNTIEKVSLLF